MEDLVEDEWPAILMKTEPFDRISEEQLHIKDEQLSESESLYSSSPSLGPSSPPILNYYEIQDIKTTTPQHTTAPCLNAATDAQSIFVTSSSTIIPQKIHTELQKAITVTTTTATSHLPLTPPSWSGSDDSDDRLFIHHYTSTNHPIHSPLISNHPKGSNGTLVLTEEEKRTLIAEGYPVPTRFPLTKAEQKYLQKIKRKIKNRISAQESRRKKKEFMGKLQNKIEVLISENSQYKKKIEKLEDSNLNLLTELKKLQEIVGRTHPELVDAVISN